MTLHLPDTTIKYTQSPKEIIEAWFQANNNRDANAKSVQIGLPTA